MSRWGWSFLRQFLLTFYISNIVKTTSLDLLVVNTVFEGYQWPLIVYQFHCLKKTGDIVMIEYKSTALGRFHFLFSALFRQSAAF